MKKILPDKNACGYAMLAVVLISAILVFVIRLFVPDYTRVSAIVTIVVAIVLDCVYIPIYFRNLRYETDGERITKHSGVIFHMSRTAEFSAVRYTTTVTTPFSGYTGLNFAILFMYGGRLRLMFLSRRDMQDIIDLASERGNI